MSRNDDYTVLVDACVLAGALRRNLILSLAGAGLFRPHWSAVILDETERAIARITDGKADTARQRAAMERAFPEAMVERAADLAGMIRLPDAGDVHVVAAAVGARADLIVTDNLRHFPAIALIPFRIEATSADDFIADCLDLWGPVALEAIREMRVRLRRPSLTPNALADKAEQQGLTQAAAILRAHLDDL